jgi:phage terminase large subunit
VSRTGSNPLSPLLLPPEPAGTKPTPTPCDYPDPGQRLKGGVALGYNSRDEEVLLAGPAGTGKTLANLLRCYRAAVKYPGARILVVRKTRVSLTESAVVTFERDMLGPSHPLMNPPVTRTSRHAYRFSNGSEIVLGGMDKPDKILSSEWDVVYVPEATDLTITDWETLTGRLRSGRMPYQQIRGDCNPTAPTHWLYKRCQLGACKLFPTTHKDNPHFWDDAAGGWTEAGEKYLKRLGNMTGHRRVRFLEGRWAQAEGVVYDGWDATVHVVPQQVIPREWPRYHAIDFGFTNPLVYGWLAEDPDGRLWLYREHYKTGVLVEDLARLVKRDIDAGHEPRPRALVGDHDAEDRATFERHAGLTVIPADKKVADGIQDVAARLRVAGDGKPRLFVVAGARCHPPDPVLVEKAMPTSTAEEFDGYVWDDEKVREQPVKENDHGMDMLRYAVRYRDKGRTLDNWKW